MKSLKNEIKTGRIQVSDGAWGSLLQEKGLEIGECPELWNINRFQDVFDVAKSYVDCGVNMIETNSFGANRFKLEHYGLQDKVFEINKAAAEISRQAAGKSIWVLGSMGPTGKILIMEDVTREELYEAFKEQSKGLEAGGANLACIETMSDIEEACIAIRAVKENSSLEVVCTFTFNKTLTGEYRTMMGVAPKEMVNAVLEAGADIIGTNCGNNFEDMIPITKEHRAAAPNIPILVHANSGAPKYVNGQTVYPSVPDGFSDILMELVKAGANIVGGCCGTNPEYIKKIVGILSDES